ncbi:MAG: nitronate monooxygenase [Longicatena sp.]
MLINELLGIKYPIFQGAMANIATPEFAACVSNSGALGIIATGAMDEVQTREAIRLAKTLTKNPFGVNVMLMNPHASAIMDVIVEEKVAVVTTGAGNPGPYISALKASGCKIFPVVASVALARRLEHAGVDGIIAEGGESGGHVGESTTMSLVPQVVSALSIPVIAAGGIASGKQLNAALSLGAIGVQIGTCLLVSEECPIHENYKKAVLRAKDMDSVVTGRSAGAPVRILKNQMSIQYMKLEQSNAPREELEKLTLGGLRKAVFEGDVRHGSLMMGQVAGMCNEILPLSTILENMIKESKEEIQNLIIKVQGLTNEK